MKKVVILLSIIHIFLGGCTIGWHHNYYPLNDSVDSFYINNDLDCIIVMGGSHARFSIKDIVSDATYDRVYGAQKPILYYGNFRQGRPKESILKGYENVLVLDTRVSTARYEQPWPTIADKKPIQFKKIYVLYKGEIDGSNRVLSYVLTSEKPIYNENIKYVHIAVERKITKTKPFLRPLIDG